VEYTITGMSFRLGTAFTRFRNSHPFMMGILISRRIISGGVKPAVCRRRIASCPLSAYWHSTFASISEKASFKKSISSISSSTTNTFFFIMLRLLGKYKENKAISYLSGFLPPG
jgi:hypothetical protein